LIIFRWSWGPFKSILFKFVRQHDKKVRERKHLCCTALRILISQSVFNEQHLFIVTVKVTCSCTSAVYINYVLQVCYSVSRFVADMKMTCWEQWICLVVSYSAYMCSGWASFVENNVYVHILLCYVQRIVRLYSKSTITVIYTVFPLIIIKVLMLDE